MTKRPAQGLLELIIAIGVILTALFGVSTLIVTTITAGQVSQTRVEAANFAREGIEIVRAMRDNTWLYQASNQKPYKAWYVDINNGNQIAQYQASSNSWTLGPCNAACQTGVDSQIMKNTDNASYFTQKCSGKCTPTKYRRLIATQLSNDTFFGQDDSQYVLVTSDVCWDQAANCFKGASAKEFLATTRLYDWK